jgi:APA family basic amino acid/polyamine antiporter
MKTGSKKLGLWMLIALVAGNMIGSGVYLLPSSLASFGNLSLYAWLATSVGALLLALVFSRLCILVPRTGGFYAYSHSGFGDYVSFKTAFCYWISTMVGNAAVALATVGYLRVFYPILNTPHATCIAAIASIWVVAIFNIIGIRYAGIFQLITTVVKLVPLLLIGVLGWHYFHPEYIQHSVNISGQAPFASFTMAAAIIFWGFIGLDSATVPLASAENPRRNVPLATLVGTLLVAAVYLITMLVLMGMIPQAQLAMTTSPFADAANIIFGPWGQLLIAAGAAVSCLGALNGWTTLQAQVSMAAADNKMFPEVFAIRNRFNVPGLGIMIAAVLESILLIISLSTNLVHQFNVLILISTLALMLPYFYSCLSQVFLIRQVPKLTMNHLFHLVVAILAAIFAFWMLLGVGEDIIVYGFVMLLLSAPLYVWMRLRK